MINILLDTGLLIQYLRGQQKTIQLLRILRKTDQLAISVVSRYEVFAGTSASEMFMTRKFLSRFETHPVTTAIADKAGSLVHPLRQKGKSAEMPDLLIASTALIHGFSLATLNRKHFEMIPGIRLYPLDNDE